MQRKMISPLSSMSVRFKLRAICRILFLIFTTLSPHYRSRPDVSRVNINTRVSLSFFSHARSIFQWSLSHLLRFLLSCSISEQVSGSPYSSLYFLPESERNSIIFLVRRLLYVRSDISIWKMEEIVEKRKKHSSFQIVLEFFENYTIYILRNKEILQLKWNFYPYFSVAYRCHVLKCKSVKWKMSVACRVTITSPYKLEIGD